MSGMRKSFAEITASGVMLPDEEGKWPDMQIGDEIKVTTPMIPDREIMLRVVYIEEGSGCRLWRAETDL